MNHGEKRVNLERLTQTKLLCKSSLGSLVRKKTPIWEKLQNGQIYRGMTKKKKKSQTYFFFFRVFTCFAKSVRNIKVSIYTGEVNTEQQGQKKVERTKGRNFQKLATTLRQVLLARNDVKILLLLLFVINIYNFPSPIRNTPGQSSHSSWSQPCRILKDKVSFPLWHPLACL